MDAYEEKRIELNNKRKSDDEKVHTDLPEVFPFATLNDFIKENRIRLIQEAIGV